MSSLISVSCLISVQLFVASDGGAGCIQEHTVAEGPPTVKLTDYCISKLRYMYSQSVEMGKCCYCFL